MIADDLAELAELRLDGEIADDAWGHLLARHGQPLTDAVDAARRTRAALAGLPSPPLPDSVLQGIRAATRREARTAPLAPAPAPRAPLRFPARWLLTTALAAGVVVAVLATRGEPAPPALPTAGVARQVPAKKDSDEFDRMASADHAPASPSPLASAPSPLPRSQAPTPVAATEASTTHVDTAPEEMRLADAEAGPADQAIAAQIVMPEQSGAAVMALPSEPPIGLAEDAPAPSADDQAFARLERDARARNDVPAAPAPAAKSAPVQAPGPVALLLAFAPAPAVAQRGQAKEASTEAKDEQAAPALRAVLPPRALLVTLANRTVSDLQVQPGSVWLLGYAANGAMIWQTALRPDEAQVVPAGRELAWTEPLAGLEVPARVVELRLRGGTTMSEALPLR